MARARGLLAALTPRWLVAALAIATGLPVVSDLHVLAETSSTFHDSLAPAEATGEVRIAAACAHGPARHAEAGSTIARSRCPLCALRSDRPLAAVRPLVLHGLVAHGSIVVARQPIALPLRTSLASSRGPPLC